MRRILALILVMAALLLPVMAPQSVAAAEEKSDMTFLRSVGILDETYRAETTYVSRAEAAMLLVRCTGTNGLRAEKIFSDVEATDLYAAEIAAAEAMGYISGFGDGTFQPKRSVTFNQMVKMLVSLLGYKQHAEALGGYPAGYMILANQKDITAGVANGGEEPLKHADMEKLIKNTLSAPLAVGETYEDGHVTVAETEETILSAWLGIDKVNGTVTADYLTCFSAERTVREGEIAIDGKVYLAGTSGIGDYICQSVIAYIDKDAETVLYVESKKSNEVTELFANDVIEATTQKLRYETANGEKTEAIGGAKLILNGVHKSPWTEEDINFEGGTLRLIPGKGGNIEFIIAERYVNRIVQTINEAEESVKFMDGGSISLKASARQKIMFSEVTGYPAELRYCYPYDIFSVMEGKGVLKIVRSARLVQGSVEEISDDGVTISGVFYPYGPGFLADKTLAKPVLGQRANFYIDYRGCLAVIDTASNIDGEYAMLISGMKKPGLTPSVQLKLYVEGKGMQGFDVAEKITLNGTPSNGAQILDGTAVGADGKAQRQLVIYKLNEEGKITSLETAMDFTQNIDDEKRLDCFSKDGYIDKDRRMNGSTVTFRDDTMQMFSTKFRVKNGVTKIFVVPEEGGADENYSMIESDSLLGGSAAGENTDMTFYDVTDMRLISVIVWQKAGTAGAEPDHDMKKLVVSEVYTSLDADGMATRIIKGYNNKGEEVRLLVEDGFETFFGMVFTDVTTENPAYLEMKDGKLVPKHKIPATAIVPGDIIQYQCTNVGVATLLNIVARVQHTYADEIAYDGYSSGRKNFDRYMGPGSTYNIACSTVIKADADAVVTSVSHKDTPDTFYERVYPASGCEVLYDSKKGTVTKINMTELQSGDKLLTCNKPQIMDFCVVIR